MTSEFEAVFVRLRDILKKHAATLAVTEDTSRCYCLSGGWHPTHKRPFPIAWVQVGKAYVGFHHMGVYCCPELLGSASKKLKARMQGKSCFNFKVMDEPLFEELEQLSILAFDRSKRKFPAFESQKTS